MDNTYINQKFYDHRGAIYTVYDTRTVPITFVQDKITVSYRGVIRGFHGDGETWKLITCLYGRLKLITYDIAMKNKQEYLLDSDDRDNVSVLVPPRVLNAHQCLSEKCIFYYKWSEYYKSPEEQWSVKYDDKNIGANWDKSLNPIISERDSNALSLEHLMNKI